MNDSLLVILVIPLAGLVAGIFAAVYPMIQSARAAKILKDQLKNGPYDDATIERSTYCYIKPRCSNIDPAQEQEIRHALMAISEDLFKKVDYFIDDDKSRKHLLILADSGMGKTSFVLNYYVYRFKKRKNRNIRIIPLGNPNPEESLLKDENKREKIVFLDALDEDTKAIANHTERIKELMYLCRDYKKVIVTCRTQFFPKDEEIPIETGIVKIAPKHLGEGTTYEFWKLYLSPLDDQAVRKYIHKRFPWWKRSLREKSLSMVAEVPFLSIRPMILAYIPELLIKGNVFRYSYEMYEEMVSAWIRREEFWVNKQQLRDFSYLIAKDIYIQRIDRGSETISPLEIDSLIRTWNIELERWQFTGRSLLNRNAMGNYKFAHRSIMEYLFVYQLFQGDTSCYRKYLTDQMRRFFFDMINNILSSISNINDIIPSFCYDLQVMIDDIDYKKIDRKIYGLKGKSFVLWFNREFKDEFIGIYRYSNFINDSNGNKNAKIKMEGYDTISIYDFDATNTEMIDIHTIYIHEKSRFEIEISKDRNIHIDDIELIDGVVFIKYYNKNELEDGKYNYILSRVHNSSNTTIKVRSKLAIKLLERYGFGCIYKLYRINMFSDFIQIDFDNDDLSLIVRYNKDAISLYRPEITG